MKSPEKIVRDYFKAYETDDQKLIENLLSENFQFSSPYDDKINLAHYMERCWPTSVNFTRYDIHTIMSTDSEALIRYTCTSVNGKQLENAEYFKIKDGKVIEIIVYFGDATK